jgi:hypothetical protein
VSDLAVGSIVKAVWTAVDIGGGQARNVQMFESEIKANGTQTLYFWLNPGSSHFPQGTYRIDIYLNGQMAKSQFFTVLPAASSPTPTRARASTATPSPPLACPSVTPIVIHPSGIIVSVTLAQGTTGDQKKPVNPTLVFPTTATLHAVVAIRNAPANTSFKAAWITVDVGTPSLCNSPIVTTPLVSEGTRNLDFSVAPATTWLPGRYLVQIYMNDVLDRAIPFQVK